VDTSILVPLSLLVSPKRHMGYDALSTNCALKSEMWYVVLLSLLWIRANVSAGSSEVGAMSAGYSIQQQDTMQQVTGYRILTLCQMVPCRTRKPRWCGL
jgi:hypothetical protein